jgi:Ni/Co efflux regulator RcnB
VRPIRPGRPGRPGFGWNGHRYRAGFFRYPTGYAYRRWGVGQVLPLLFLSSTYYFTNYAVLGLDPPPYGYQWVRYGPDVLLVNIRTGQIMDVEYGVFY